MAAARYSYHTNLLMDATCAHPIIYDCRAPSTGLQRNNATGYLATTIHGSRAVVARQQCRITTQSGQRLTSLPSPMAFDIACHCHAHWNYTHPANNGAEFFTIKVKLNNLPELHNGLWHGCVSWRQVSLSHRRSMRRTRR